MRTWTLFQQIPKMACLLPPPPNTPNTIRVKILDKLSDASLHKKRTQILTELRVNRKNVKNIKKNILHICFNFKKRTGKSIKIMMLVYNGIKRNREKIEYHNHIRKNKEW